MKHIKKYSWSVVKILFLYMFIGILLLPHGRPNCLPVRLTSKQHSDYSLAVFSKISWEQTSYCLARPPQVIWCSSDTEFTLSKGIFGPKPIPKPGEWHFALVRVRPSLPFYLPYFAFTTKTNKHFRVGIRWDDVDNYYVFPSAAWHKL